MTTLRASLVALLAAAALLAPGCGGSSQVSAQELEESVVEARDRVDSALESVTEAQSKEEFLERMNDASDTIAHAAGEIDDVAAPKRYEEELANLVAWLEQLAFDVQATADQVREPEFGDLLDGTRGLSFESWNGVNRALAAFADKGIAVEPLERH